MKTQDYALFFENITKETPIKEYENVFDINAKFKDPFNEVKGLDKIYDIFQDMYIKLDNPRFKVIEIVEQGDISYLRWIFEFNFKNDSLLNSFEGVSRVEFNENQKVISHVDYWDSSENLYEKIPILSFFIKLVKRKIKS
ncbi:hypothetical protein LPB137_01370 [Poseidonibacter parvus]|uniref:SnoaL-like domain-containing protein n=1 Tax=Poseidonibacter parvus TaxID=1850254 RepID=A0A1P8KJ46_9BACT|nr:nuclear transport factor 2 family protein [Poseidonibacter parvus]APW64580.1 hypothetical protein LPB137_01370 [Poseidonibacter parvus]